MRNKRSMKSETLKNRIDDIASRYVSDATPGFSLLIAEDGEPVLRSAYGMADIESGTRIRPEDHFIIASNTKQFTCLAVLMLRERGLIDLDETIERFFPDFPDYRKKVTVRMLMCHTSGITEYFDDEVLGQNEEFLRTADTAALIEMMKNIGDKLHFEPDTDFSYCNTAYVMLGSIIEQLSGKSFGRFLKEEIFDVLEMSHSVAPDYMDETDVEQVTGYMSPEAGEEYPKLFENGERFVACPYDMLEVGYADGNISTNVDDILKWHRFLFDETDDRLVPYEKRKEMWTPHKLKDGRETSYGLGLITGDLDEDHKTFDDRREIWHTGGTMGFISRISYFPDDKISVVMLTNWNGIDRDNLFCEIMQCVNGDGSI